MTVQLSKFCQALKDAGFTHRQGGIFSKKKGRMLYFWVSTDDQSPQRKVAIGCIFTSLVKKIYELTGKTSIPARPSFPISWGPPAFLIDFQIPNSPHELPEAVQELEEILERFTDLETVIDHLLNGKALFSWNRDHVVAAGLALLGRCETLQEFCSKSEKVGTFREFFEAALVDCAVGKRHNKL